MDSEVGGDQASVCTSDGIAVIKWRSFVGAPGVVSILPAGSHQTKLGSGWYLRLYEHAVHALIVNRVKFDGSHLLWEKADGRRLGQARE